MRRVMTVVAVCLTFVASSVAFLSGPASAVTCSTAWSNKDTTGGHTPQHSAIRSGPYSSCTEVLTTAIGAFFDYDCYVVNSLGNTWTHVHGDGQSLGWIYDGNLDDGGSVHPCL